MVKQRNTQRGPNIGKHNDGQTSGNPIMAIPLDPSTVHPVSESRVGVVPLVLQTNGPLTNLVMCNIVLLQKTLHMALGIRGCS